MELSGEGNASEGSGLMRLEGRGEREFWML